jgi:hypothetical protein
LIDIVQNTPAVREQEVKLCVVESLLEAAQLQLRQARAGLLELPVTFSFVSQAQEVPAAEAVETPTPEFSTEASFFRKQFELTQHLLDDLLIPSRDVDGSAYSLGKRFDILRSRLETAIRGSKSLSAQADGMMENISLGAYVEPEIDEEFALRIKVSWGEMKAAWETERLLDRVHHGVT